MEKVRVLGGGQGLTLCELQMVVVCMGIVAAGASPMYEGLTNCDEQQT